MVKKDNTVKKRKDGRVILEARIDAGKIEDLVSKLSSAIDSVKPTLLEVQQAFTILQTGYFMSNCVSQDGYADLKGVKVGVRGSCDKCESSTMYR